MMREFEKSNKLEGVSYDVRGLVLEEAERMQEEGISILKLNTGNPAPFGFEAPNEVIRDLMTQKATQIPRGSFLLEKQLSNIAN